MYLEDGDLVTISRKSGHVIVGMEESRFSATGTDLDLLMKRENGDDALYLEDGDHVTISRKSENVAAAAAATAAEKGRRSRSESESSETRLAPQAASHLRFHIRHRTSHTLEMSLEDIGKGGYKHFMLKEVIEQPKVRERMMRRSRPISRYTSLCLQTLKPRIHFQGAARLHERKG